MTDPRLLTYDQLCQYVTQLQQTVVYWQDNTARGLGVRHEEMIAFLKTPPHNDPDEVKRVVDMDWVNWSPA